MTDYRDLPHPGLNPNRGQDFRSTHGNGTSISGILIALALIGLLFFGLIMMFGGSGEETVNPTAVAPATTEQTQTPTPVSPATD